MSCNRTQSHVKIDEIGLECLLPNWFSSVGKSTLASADRQGGNQFLPGLERRQLGGARAVQHRAGDWCVIELYPFLNFSQEQAAAAHVAAPDEIDRKHQSRTEDRKEHVDVLRRRNA